MITITESALKKLKNIYEKDNMLTRLLILGGGCSGFSFKFYSDKQKNDDILICDYLIVDELSYSILKGSTIDYVSDLTGSYFSVKIPSAISYCGCGNSFNLL